MNFETKLWEAAGHIEWSSNYSAIVYFGIERVTLLPFITIKFINGVSRYRDQVPLRELRKLKKNTSKYATELLLLISSGR